MVYKTQGTCSREIHFDVENNKLKNVSFVGGCNGNLKGIGLLVEGMDIDDVIKRVEGVSCNGRPTSCPDQLARALKQYKEQQYGIIQTICKIQLIMQHLIIHLKQIG